MQTVSIETSKHTAAVARKQRSAPLEPQVADRLLDLLSSDDIFRRLFKKDPAAALAKAGYCGPSLTPPGSPSTRPAMNCAMVRRIAPKAEIMAAREAIKEYLTSSVSLTNPHCFEAGKINASLRRK